MCQYVLEPYIGYVSICPSTYSLRPRKTVILALGMETNKEAKRIEYPYILSRALLPI